MIFSSWAFELIAPTSVFLSSGSPTRIVERRSLSFSMSGPCDGLLDEQARAGAAHLALVEVDAVDDALDRLVERGVLEDDVRGLAAELQGQRLVRARGRLVDELADAGRAGERDLVDVGVADEVHADVRRARARC